MSNTNTEPDKKGDRIELFIDDITYQGKTTRTQEAYRRVLRDFEAYLNSRELSLEAANHRDCMAYIHQLRGKHAESTVATYATYLHRFYEYMVQIDVFTGNPMGIVSEEIDESINTDPARRDISVSQMQSFLRGISHPLERAVLVTFLKTGVRAGELCNLDVRDIHISGIGSDHRPRLGSRPNSLFVDSKPAEDTVYNGERRRASNKRKRATTIPIDEELSTALQRWLTIRPDPVSDADPLFVSTSDHWGRRLTPDMVHHLVEANARDANWYRDGGGPEENVTPHYFRHFFTTHLRDRTGDRGVVKYLRGDVAQDVIDTYTHDWGSRVRDIYINNIYTLY